MYDHCPRGRPGVAKLSAQDISRGKARCPYFSAPVFHVLFYFFPSPRRAKPNSTNTTNPTNSTQQTRRTQPLEVHENFHIS